MAALTFEQARASVLAEVSKAAQPLAEEMVPLDAAAGRVLSSPVFADRDYPPLSRSVRDGFAVRAADLPGSVTIIGEVRAGDVFAGEVRPGEAVEIMTGAPLPQGADSVVMVEHVTVSGASLRTDRALRPGENVNDAGSEARQGGRLLEPGVRLGFAEVALLAMVGCARAPVYRKPEVAIVATGDEILELEASPLPHQIRNSNTYSLAAQVRRAGGQPVMLPLARDNYDSTREAVEQGLRYSLLLISGGVSAGKYDLVERVLADAGARFFFDRVAIQPGQPVVFGAARGKFFFGLPGNPASTMVTFEVFARAAVERIGGETDPSLPLLWSRLACDFRHRPGITRFLPARLSADGSTVTPSGWGGSGDIPALARANAFLVADPGRESWAAGDLIRVLRK